MMAIDNSEKSEFIEQRIEQLKTYFTYSLYSNICRSLFEKHKLLFSFILTSKLKEAEKKVMPAQYEFLIANIAGLENPIGEENPSEDDWMPNAIWNKFCELSLVEKDFLNIVRDFGLNEDKWRAIYESDRPHHE